MTDSKHILIVDDYLDAVEIWALYLRSFGYRVSTAGDGAEAVAQAERLLPDRIVLDLKLPRLSGIEVARRLRANPGTQSIPLIAATGYSLERQLDLARVAGFDEIVVKRATQKRIPPPAFVTSPAISVWNMVSTMGSTLPTGGANDYRYRCA